LLFAAALLLASTLLGESFPAGASAQSLSAGGVASEAGEALGEGVVGIALPAWPPLSDPDSLARWEPGEWRYRITAGPRRGQTERESLAQNGMTVRGEAWERTVGQEYTLHLRRTAEGSLVLPSEIAHAHDALVRFEPPLTYLIAGLAPGEHRVFDGAMDVYSSSRPTMKLYRGKIRATTVHAGVYEVATPAGTFRAVALKTDYEIQIIAIASVKDTLYTFYAEGVGKVAEAERRRIAVGLLKTDTKAGKVLLSFTPARPTPDRQAP